MRDVCYKQPYTISPIPHTLVHYIIFLLHIITLLIWDPPTPPLPPHISYIPPPHQQMSIHEVLPFHEGETSLHQTLHIPDRDNPTQPFLSPFAARVLQRSPLIALGAVDDQGRPWTTLWGGEPAFARPIAPSIIAIKSSVARTHDPVIDILLGAAAPGEVVQGGENGALMSGLAIDLDSRLRAKFSGRMVAGALQDPEQESGGATEVQLVMKIESSLGAYPPLLPL